MPHTPCCIQKCPLGLCLCIAHRGKRTAYQRKRFSNIPKKIYSLCSLSVQVLLNSRTSVQKRQPYLSQTRSNSSRQKRYCVLFQQLCSATSLIQLLCPVALLLRRGVSGACSARVPRSCRRPIRNALRSVHTPKPRETFLLAFDKLSRWIQGVALATQLPPSEEKVTLSCETSVRGDGTGRDTGTQQACSRPEDN